MTHVSLVPWDDPVAGKLRDAQQAELRALYGEDDIEHDMVGGGFGENASQAGDHAAGVADRPAPSTQKK